MPSQLGSWEVARACFERVPYPPGVLAPEEDDGAFAITRSSWRPRRAEGIEQFTQRIDETTPIGARQVFEGFRVLPEARRESPDQYTRPWKLAHALTGVGYLEHVG